ncbi:MAG TPA: zf-HC2 domain-containing protein [Thermoanaerobaculia bacterium]|nr:zf-HC2 domain-containing protein [Thermoanaerobaculia bacterium]
MDHAYVEEHDLVEAYLKDRLSESERAAFEAHYFECETCLEELEMANDFREGMRQVAAEDTVRAHVGLLAGLALLSRGRRIALGGVLLLLLAFPLGLLVQRNLGLERQLAEARAVRPPAPTPAAPTDAGQRIASLESQLRSLQQAGAVDRQQRQRLEEELAKERQARAAAESEAAVPQVNIPIFSLAMVRSGEEDGREPVNRIPLSAAAGPVILTLELATVDYPSYRASLRGEDGKETWQAGGLRPDSRDALVILLPSRMLGTGTYQLAIEGIRDDGKGFAVAAYPFRVVRER